MGDDGQDTTIPLRDLRGRLDTACGRLVDSMAVELGVRAKLDEIAELPVAEALRRSSEDLDLHYCVTFIASGCSEAPPSVWSGDVAACTDWSCSPACAGSTSPAPPAEPRPDQPLKPPPETGGVLPTVVRRRKPDAAVQAELARLEATGLARSDAAALVVVEDHGVPARFKQDALNYEARRRVQARTRGVGDGATERRVPAAERSTLLATGLHEDALATYERDLSGRPDSDPLAVFDMPTGPASRAAAEELLATGWTVAQLLEHRRQLARTPWRQISNAGGDVLFEDYGPEPEPEARAAT